MNSLLKLSTFVFAASIALGSSAFAQSQPAAKATAKVGNVAVMKGPITNGTSEGEWTTVLSNSIKTSSQKDLLVDVAFECGLYTRTLTKSKAGVSDTSSAEASIQVRVLVDGREAAPGQVVFARRAQELTATFQGLIDGCLSVDLLTGAVILDEDCLRPEELELVLDTMNANSFNFLLMDVGTGTHKVEVQARIDLGASAQQGSAEARATIGKGAVTVEEVRMIKNEDAIQF